MRRLARTAGLTVLCVVVLAAILAGVGLAYRAYRQHVNRVAMAIQAPNGIDEAMYSVRPTAPVACGRGH